MNTRVYRVAGDPPVRVRLATVALACCTLEVESAIRRGLLLPEPEKTDADISVVLVTGTVTDLIAAAVVRACATVPQPVAVVAYGVCASTGGPYWDAPTVTKGIDQLVPVDAYVPGCPPRPEALVACLRRIADRELV